MGDELFNVERLRRNFDRARDPVPEAGPDRLGAARVPRELFAAANDCLDQIRRRLPTDLPGQGRKVAPFVAEVARLLVELEKAMATTDAGSAPSGDAAMDVQGTRDALCLALCDLEDICGALLGIG